MEGQRPSSGGDAGEADDRVGGGVRERVDDDLRGAGALDDDVGAGGERRDRVSVVAGAEVGYQTWLGAVGDPVSDVDVVSLLGAEERGEQADGTGSGDQHGAGGPGGGSGADAFDVIPRLGHDAGRFGQHSEVSERRVDRHGEAGVDAVALRGVAVALLDASFGEAAVAAHVPLADGTAWAGHRVGATDDADDEVAHREAGAVRSLQDTAE